MKKKHVNIPIFLPNLACPHQCIFCNQNHISSQEKIPTPLDTQNIIERNLVTIPNDYTIQVAFFGGSFTCLPIELQIQYLSVVQPFIEKQQVTSIRISTRPDYINEDTLSTLKKFHVADIELGAQSTNDEILKLSGRGHNRNEIEKASKLIIDYGFNLGLQMMIGLPGDNYETAIQTAKDIIQFGAKTTRIYPTLVIADTPLAKLYTQGKYKPLSLTEAVHWSKNIYQLFIQNNVTVLKVGLHPNNDFTSKKYLLAGPYHQSFKELLFSEIWFEKLIRLKKEGQTNKNIVIYVSATEINNAIGYNSKNKQELRKFYKNVQFSIENTLQDYEFTYCHY